jgi:membrane-associated phospholipid phosphatase
MRTMRVVPLIAALMIVVLSAPRALSQSLSPVRIQPMETETWHSAPGDSAGVDEREVYHLNPIVDYTVIGVGTAWSVYALSNIYNKTPPTEAEILLLDRNNVNAFDRWAIYPYDTQLAKISNYPFYAAMPLPLLFFVTNGPTRRDFFKLTLLYWETMSVVGLLGTTSTYFVDRYRPYCYTDETPMEQRTNKVATNSFFSGHVEVVAAPTFMIAKVYSDYYPESSAKWVFYGAAVAMTGWVSYCRLLAGEHFPTDILLGAAVGASCGILVPQMHKVGTQKLSFLPYSDGEYRGLAVTYHF